MQVTIGAEQLEWGCGIQKQNTSGSWSPFLSPPFSALSGGLMAIWCSAAKSRGRFTPSSARVRLREDSWQSGAGQRRGALDPGVSGFRLGFWREVPFTMRQHQGKAPFFPMEMRWIQRAGGMLRGFVGEGASDGSLQGRLHVVF